MFRAVMAYFLVIVVLSTAVFCKSFDEAHVEDRLQDTPATVDYKVDVVTRMPIHVTNERFLSFTIDIGILNNKWANFSFGSTKLHTLTSALSPAFLRLGGKAQDFLLFKPQCNEDTLQHGVDLPEKYLCPEAWDGINKFCSNTSLQLIFGLNLLLRTKDGRWNSTNAGSLLDYNTYNVAWELGNEPNSFMKHANISLTGSQIGGDFNSLRSMLQSRPRYTGASIYGPDISGLRKMKKPLLLLSRFLSTTNATNATTFHNYYLNGRTATVDDFLDPETLDGLLPQGITLVTSLVTRYSKGGKVWLGESGSAYGGGAPNISDTFVAGFLFLDKLGMGAMMGLDVVIRQSYYGGHYTMLDLVTLDPKPDYWSAYIYKYLVGPKVLRADVTPVSSQKNSYPDFVDGSIDKKYLRVYAHCTATSKSGYDAGAVTLLILNMHKTNSANITLLRKLTGRVVDQYLLTPNGPMNMTSPHVNLNGQLLQLVNETTFPDIKPVKIKRGDPLLVPPLSYGFYVIPKAKAKTCK